MSDRHAPDKHAFDHHDDRELDELLDRALVSYVAAEPDPSMRARIMARIDDASTRHGVVWLLGCSRCSGMSGRTAARISAEPANHPPEDLVSKATTIASAPAPPPSRQRPSQTRCRSLRSSSHRAPQAP